MKKIITFFSLFGSMSTLLCCALPVTLVTIGMGATFASLTANVPGLVWLMERKDALFVVTGALLSLSFYLMKKSQRLACPVDIDQREVCTTSREYTQIIFWVSVVVFLIGVFFSYVLPQILY